MARAQADSTPAPQPSHSRVEPEEVQSRRDLAAYLSQSLSSQYRVFGEDDITQTSTYIKSYIVEAHIAEDEAAGWPSPFRNISRTSDASLSLLRDQNDVAFFVDSRDPRFVVLHSIARTSETDETIEKVTDGTSQGFDRAWLPTQFLLGTRRGQLRGFKFSHQLAVSGAAKDNALMPLEENDTLVSIPDSLKLLDQISRQPPNELPQTSQASVKNPKSRLAVSDNRTALEDYRTIKGSGIFEGRQALDWIQFLATTEDGGSITNGVYSTGKVVGNGTSIALHLLVVEAIRDRYARAIRRLEDEFAIGWVPSGGGRVLSGSPLLFRFPDEVSIPDLSEFARSLFRSSKPFRLFGVPSRSMDNRVDVEALDLHTGDPFAVELTRDWMRLYLPKGTCGNVVARLFTNLQHSLNSDVQFATGSGESIFGELDAK